MTTPGSNFELPGMKYRGDIGYALAIAFAYSGTANTRGVENPFYAFCAMVLQDLIIEFTPTALCMEQHELETFTVSQSPSFALTDSIASLPQKNAHGLVPDFVIILTRAVKRATKEAITRGDRLRSSGWDKIRIEKAIVGLVVEVKRPPTRSALSADRFSNSLRHRLGEAIIDSLDQAKEVLRGYPETNMLLLLVWSGEWYQWRKIVRDDFNIVSMPRREYIDGVDEGQIEGSVNKSKDNGSVPQSSTEESSGMTPPESGDEEGKEEADEDKEEDEEEVEDDTNENDSAEHKNSDDSDSDDSDGDEYVQHETYDQDNQQQGSGRVLRPNRKAVGEYKTPNPLVDLDKEPQIPVQPKRPAEEIQRTRNDGVAKLADFKRYTPEDLKKIHQVQQLLNGEEYANSNMFRKKWTEPILFGTEVSNQHLSLIHQFLEKLNGSLDEPNTVADA